MGKWNGCKAARRESLKPRMTSCGVVLKTKMSFVRIQETSVSNLQQRHPFLFLLRCKHCKTHQYWMVHIASSKHIVCIMYAYCMYIVCILCVYGMYMVCVSYVYCMFVVTYCMFIAWLLSAYCMCILYMVTDMHVYHSMCVRCILYVSLFTLYE